eukprot:4250453-Prymnesium_polylepis.1
MSACILHFYRFDLMPPGFGFEELESESDGSAYGIQYVIVMLAFMLVSFVLPTASLMAHTLRTHAFFLQTCHPRRGGSV